MEHALPGYYVETWQPDGTEAEAHGEFASFDDAINWITQRRWENPRRIGRLRTREVITDEQRKKLARYRVERI